MRILSLLTLVFTMNVSWSESTAAVKAFDPDDSSLRTILCQEGIYELKVVYRTRLESRPYPKLDRMVILLSENPGKVRLSLAQGADARPFINFNDVDYSIDPMMGLIRLSGAGGSGLFGQISIEIDPEKRTFTGFFTDSLAEGYKELSGKALTTVGEFLDLATVMPAPFKAGVYREENGNRRLVLRYYSDGSLSVVVQTPYKDDVVVRSYTDGVFLQELGVMYVIDKVPSLNGAVKKLTLIVKPPEKSDAPVSLKAQLISTAGRSQVSDFIYEKEALFPEAWTSAGAERALKERAPAIKREFTEKIKNANYVHFNGHMQLEKLTSVMNQVVDLKKGHSMFFIGYREDFISRDNFRKFLDRHIKLAARIFENRGLKGYFTFATDVYECGPRGSISISTKDRSQCKVGCEIRVPEWYGW